MGSGRGLGTMGRVCLTSPSHTDTQSEWTQFFTQLISHEKEMLSACLFYFTVISEMEFFPDNKNILCLSSKHNRKLLFLLAAIPGNGFWEFWEGFVIAFAFVPEKSCHHGRSDVWENVGTVGWSLCDLLPSVFFTLDDWQALRDMWSDVVGVRPD